MMVRLGGTLGVLMWKHGMVRLRRFIHSAFEFISPAILFLLFLSLPANLIQSKEDPEYISEPKTFEDLRHVRKIFFKPQTSQSLQLIESAANHLDIKNTADLSPFTADEGYWSYNNETDFMKYMDASETTGAGVIFQNLNGPDWPKKLKYTIRIMNDFKTEMYETFSPGPHERFGDSYETFISLQWAIDKAYLGKSSGQQVGQELMIQHFPRPKTVIGTQEWAELIQFCTTISPLTFFLFFVSRLVLERASGIKELMKMVGVPPGTLHLSHILNSSVTCAVFVIVGLLILKWPSNPLVPYTNGLFIAFTLFLYFIYIIALAFFCSTLLNTTNRAVTLSFFIYVLTTGVAAYTADKLDKSAIIFYLLGLFPHVPVLWFWSEVGALEKYKEGSNFGNMLESHTQRSSSVAGAWLYLLLQIHLMYFLAWYMDCVRPGNYGIAKPWNFIFRMQLCSKMQWCSKEKVNPNMEESEPVNRSSGEYFESPPNNLQAGIKVVNVTKVYGSWGGPKNKALSNVNLEIYKGEITVLLGHNGAGKTTLMSIITGMYSATEGKVFINGKEITENLVEIRQNIGLCPQHNLTFNDLTVKEHIIFFAMLKGATYEAASANCKDLLTQLKLLDKAKNMSGQLSGGMKRRLQLACALAGGAEVLILDEPTSGLDVETRRELWNLILSLRGSRTVLLTTHFMEEADALGDRVAALHSGVLRCHATPMFLKKAIGTGYRLSLTLDPQYSKDDIVEAVSSVIPGSQLKESSPTGLLFALPAKESPQFPKLFNVLEERKNSLKIKSIGVGVTTLEEVFLRLCSDDHSEVLDTTDNGHSNGRVNHALEYKRLNGTAYYAQQIQALLKRQYKYILSKLKTFILIEICLPVIFILILSYLTNTMGTKSWNPPKEMNLDLYERFGQSKIFYNIAPFSSDIMELLKKEYNKFEFVKTDNVVRAILDEGSKSMSFYDRLLIGLELNKTNANAIYSTSVRHTLPVAVNLLSNMLAKHYLGGPDNPRTITTVNHPIDVEKKHEMLDGLVQQKNLVMCLVWAVITSALVASFMIPMITIAILERNSGSRHIRIMSGCPAAVYWGTTCIFHMGIAVVVMVPTILIAAGLLDFQRTFDNLHFLASIILITLLFVAAFLMCMYFLSYFMTEGGATSMLSVSTVLFCIVIPLITHFVPGTFSTTLFALSLVFPPYNYAYGLVKMVDIAQMNALCNLNKHFCPAGETIGFLSPGCCTSNSPFGPLSYFDVKEKHAGAQLLLLTANFFVYGALVLLMEYGIINRLWDKLMNSGYKPPAPFYQDSMVVAEKTYVDEKITNGKRNTLVGEDTALVHNLHKNYRPLFRKACNSVKGVSFSVKQGECFGLLGVNGAGKSTIFKMLTGSESITRGKINCNGHDIQEQRSAYLSTLTYCPQFGGLDNFLSGWDSVELMVKLRGVPKAQVNEEVSSWIDYVDLTELKDRTVGAYSGGCQRRCATAAALAGLGGSEGKCAALLDEPTAGVDPGARRRVWRALRRSLKMGLSVVITSHSMDETEALCGRIAIMSRGQLGALGSAAALRAAHATGYSAQIKLRTPIQHASNTDEVDGSQVPAMPMTSTDFVTTEKANKLKEHIRENFNSVLKDEHETMLHYHIEDTIRYSDLFSKMESIKISFADIIEDYTISETTLEEVFLSFAKDGDITSGPQQV